MQMTSVCHFVLNYFEYSSENQHQTTLVTEFAIIEN